MSEREKSDFTRGDTNNDHFFKRGRNAAESERTQKKQKTDDSRLDIPQKTGRDDDTLRISSQ